MNDAQREKLINVLADAFDKAALLTTHKKEAAFMIEMQLRANGFLIKMVGHAK